MVDSRSNAAAKLPPPEPLPHVSRRALARVNNPLPIPCECRYCKGEVVLVPNEQVYGKPYGNWPYMYICISCEAYVGLHPHTDLPLGTMADKPLRMARKIHKKFFQQLLETWDKSRGQLYKWLADQMEIDSKQCHWSLFELADCAKAGDICRKQLTTLRNAR